LLLVAILKSSGVLQLPAATGCWWPAAGANFLDFVAALPTTSMHQLRLLWSRQIKKSNDSCQSGADVQNRSVGGSNRLVRVIRLFDPRAL
jgi:hypothetical protein